MSYEQQLGAVAGLSNYVKMTALDKRTKLIAELGAHGVVMS